MRQRARFIVTCGSIFLPVIWLCLYSGTNLFAYVDGEGPCLLWNREKVNAAQTKQYDVIVLGDSTANAAYVPALLSDRTLNLSLGGATPSENYHTLRNWLAHNQPPKTCYISFADFHFAIEDWFWKRTMYLHLFRPWQNLEIMRTAMKFKEPSILTEHYAADFIGYELWFPDKYVTALINAGFNMRYNDNRAAKRSVELHSGCYMTRNVRESPSANIRKFDRFTVEPFFDYYYRELIELCLDNGISVHIVKLPIPNPAYSNNYYKTFWNYYGKLKRDYPNITVDFFPGYDGKYFVDRWHMNNHGSLRFSTELKTLYPNDFGDEALSTGQVAAINDYVKAENKVEEILHWINGKDYTVAVCDRTGEFLSFYKKLVAEDMRVSSLKLTLVKPEKTESTTAYNIAGDDHAGTERMVTGKKEGLEVTLPNGTVQECKVADDRLGLLVIDHYNGRPVCAKSFKYQDGQFLLARP